MTLTKQQILSAPLILKEIEIAEWGGSVKIRPLTLAEQAKIADLGTKYDKSLVVAKAKGIMLPLIQWAVVDDDGNALFDNQDIDALMNKSASALLRLQEEILAYSGLTKESREELEKNLLSAQSAEPDLP